MRLAIMRGGSVWRAAVLGAVAFATVFWANSAFAQAAYPNGTRDPAEWYYCFASQFTPNGGDPADEWSDMECLHLLWQESTGGGGDYESLQFEGYVEGMDSGGRLNAYIVPPQGIRLYEYSCTAQVVKCRGEFGGSTHLLRTQSNSGFATFGGFNVAAPSPAVGECAANAIDVVSDVWATENDNFFDRDPAQMFAAGETVNYPIFEIYAMGTHDSQFISSEFSCSIIGWESWSDWTLENPEWSPGDGDFEVPPAPPGWEPYPYTPIGITPVPMSTVATTVTFGIGELVEVDCYQIVPTTAQTVDTWFGDWSVGFDGVEMCTRERSLSLQLDEFDIGGWAIGLLSFLGVGVLWSMFRR